MNFVVMMGHLVRDPEVRYSQGEKGTAVCRYRIAVRRDYKREGEPDTDFFNIVSFGKGAEFVSKYFKKGDMIAVQGQLQNREYVTKTGEKRHETEIKASSHYFCSGKPQAKDEPATDVFTEFEGDDDLPFD